MVWVISNDFHKARQDSQSSNRVTVHRELQFLECFMLYESSNVLGKLNIRVLGPHFPDEKLREDKELAWGHIVARWWCCGLNTGSVGLL